MSLSSYNLRSARAARTERESPPTRKSTPLAEKVVIIGSGPAGWSAAIYAARANLQPLVYEGAMYPDMVPLGQLFFTTEVENYPGFPAGDVRSFSKTAIAKEFQYLLQDTPEEHVRDGRPHYAVQGPELVLLMKQQAINFGTRVVSDDIVGVEFGDGPSGTPHRLTSGDGKTVEARTVIVATGARANYLGLPSEEQYKNRGVSACAVCDGALPRFKKKPIVVVGGGDTAVEEATYLTNFASQVYMVHRRDELRASKIMQQRVLNNPKIEMVWNSAVKECRGDDKNGLTSVVIGSTTGDETREIEASGMFVAIGHTPNTAFLKGMLEMNNKGYLKLTTPFRTNTSVPGVFAAGDVSDDYYRQAITSAGTGCMAALDAERLLAQFEHH
jgi:thioredoxin reductase (NADPH)